MEGKRLKKCSTSTDAVKKGKKLKRKKIQKKTSVKKEMRKLRKSFKDLTETVKQVQEKKKEEYVEPKDWVGKDCMTICVKGFDASLPKDDIKTALTNHFGSCGVIRNVLVPTVFETGASKGSAHISMTLKDENKALTLDGSLLGGRRLDVRMARFGYPNNRGCKSCPLVFMEGKMEAFYGFYDHLLRWKIEQSMKKRWNNQRRRPTTANIYPCCYLFIE